MAGAYHCVLVGPTGQPVDIGQAVARYDELHLPIQEVVSKKR